MSKKRPTGFLDLPLELRQQIYDYFQPADQIMNFPESQQRLSVERTMTALCLADDRINEELQDMVFKRCDAHIMVTSHLETGLPPALEWNRFQHITITIDYYPEHTQPVRWPGMEELVRCLRYGNPEVLPDTVVRLREESRRGFEWTDLERDMVTYRWHGPFSDCQCGRDGHREYDRYRHLVFPGMRASWEVPGGERHADTEDLYDLHITPTLDEVWLRSAIDSNGNPFAIEILDHLLDLPPCKSALVQSLLGLSPRRAVLPRHDPEGRMFDQLYMLDLCAALGRWLEGDHQGIELPRGISKDYGEPRLEQIAYQKCKGQFYYAGGRYSGREEYKYMWAS